MKPRPNHSRYIRVLRAMTPEQRLSKAFELTDFSRALFVHGLKRRFPDRSPEAFEELLRSRLSRSDAGEIRWVRINSEPTVFTVVQ